MKLGIVTLCGEFSCDIRLQNYALSAVLRGMRSHRQLPCFGFPVLFRRPFVVFGRKHANGSNMNSHINTLLGISGLRGAGAWRVSMHSWTATSTALTTPWMRPGASPLTIRTKPSCTKRT